MRAYYSNSAKAFLEEDVNSIKGKLDLASTEFHTLLNTQQNSWVSFIDIMKKALVNTEWASAQILLEYKIPRRSKRIDCVLLIKDLIIVIEFKDEAKDYESAFQRQVEDYCLDLRDFHKESRDLTIIPVVLAPLAHDADCELKKIDDEVQETLFANAEGLTDLLNRVNSFYSTGNNVIDVTKWEGSEYLPTPTMIEAAQTLFSGQNVE
jgi:hypothetical protein